jgi:hypothetical protein
VSKKVRTGLEVPVTNISLLEQAYLVTKKRGDFGSQNLYWVAFLACLRISCGGLNSLQWQRV